MSKVDETQSGWPIIGHSNIVSYLKHCLGSSQVGQAYLFVGPAHLGKTTLTKHFIDQLVKTALSIDLSEIKAEFLGSLQGSITFSNVLPLMKNN